MLYIIETRKEIMDSLSKLQNHQIFAGVSVSGTKPVGRPDASTNDTVLLVPGNIRQAAGIYSFTIGRQVKLTAFAPMVREVSGSHLGVSVDINTGIVTVRDQNSTNGSILTGKVPAYKLFDEPLLTERFDLSRLADHNQRQPDRVTKLEPTEDYRLPLTAAWSIQLGQAATFESSGDGVLSCRLINNPDASASIKFPLPTEQASAATVRAASQASLVAALGSEPTS